MENINELISDLQKGLEGTPEYMVGQQLKDICKEKACAAIVAEDLKNKSMGLKAAAGRIKAWADEQHKKKGGSCRSSLRQRKLPPPRQRQKKRRPRQEPGRPWRSWRLSKRHRKSQTRT